MNKIPSYYWVFLYNTNYPIGRGVLNVGMGRPR